MRAGSVNRAQARRRRHAERLRGGGGEVPFDPGAERAAVDHADGHEAARGGRRSPACRRAACDAPRRASSAAASRRRRCDCRTGRARTRWRAAAASERAASASSGGRRRRRSGAPPRAGTAAPPRGGGVEPARGLDCAVAAGAQDGLQGPHVGTLAALAQRALSQLRLARGAFRRRRRRLAARTTPPVSPREVVAATRIRKTPARTPTPRPGRAAAGRGVVLG